MHLKRQLYLFAVTTLVVACGEKGEKITILDKVLRMVPAFMEDTFSYNNRYFALEYLAIKFLTFKF